MRIFVTYIRDVFGYHTGVVLKSEYLVGFLCILHWCICSSRDWWRVSPIDRCQREPGHQNTLQQSPPHPCLYTSGIPSCTQLTPGHVMSDLVQNHR